MIFGAVNQIIEQHVNAGVIVLDCDANVIFINHFIETHTDLTKQSVLDKNLYDLFPELPKNWFKRKLNAVFSLNSPVFSAWEQRLYLLKMRHTRPITTASEFMVQNATLVPIVDKQGDVVQACLLIEDATDVCYYQQKLNESLAKLEQASNTDGLTQVANRHYWEQCFANAFREAQTNEKLLSVVLFDLDKFKNINDTFGHVAGDAVLREVALFSQSYLREGDIVGRYGGEEFGILLPNTNAVQALSLAEKIRMEIQFKKIKTGSVTVSVTVSMGVIQMDATHARYEDMITRADMALYQSKRDGRNRVTVYQA